MTHFVLDENVDDALSDLLRAAGHTVHRVKETQGEGTEDPDVVAYALSIYAIVVTRNHKHFHSIARRALEGDRKDHRHWGLLSLRCDEPHEASRVAFLLPTIEREIELARQRYPTGLLLHMEILDTQYVVHL